MDEGGGRLGKLRGMLIHYGVTLILGRADALKFDRSTFVRSGVLVRVHNTKCMILGAIFGHSGPLERFTPYNVLNDASSTTILPSFILQTTTVAR